MDAARVISSDVYMLGQLIHNNDAVTRAAARPRRAVRAWETPRRRAAGRRIRRDRAHGVPKGT